MANDICFLIGERPMFRVVISPECTICKKKSLIILKNGVFIVFTIIDRIHLGIPQLVSYIKGRQFFWDFLLFKLKCRVSLNFFYFLFIRFSCNKHESFKKNFLDTMRGGGGGVFGLFLVKIYKKCSRGGGGGVKMLKNEANLHFL
jgi:hypothetical protein